MAFMDLLHQSEDRPVRGTHSWISQQIGVVGFVTAQKKLVLITLDP